MLPMTQLSPDPWAREYVVGKHLLYTACNFEMLIACLRGNMKAMNGNWKLWKIRIEMVLNLSITHPCVHYHFKGFHTNWMNFSANTLYFPTQVVDLHAGPSNICRALSHRECHGNESKREAHELRLKGVQHCKAGALAGKEKGDQNPGCISTIWGLQVWR